MPTWRDWQTKFSRGPCSKWRNRRAARSPSDLSCPRTLSGCTALSVEPLRVVGWSAVGTRSITRRGRGRLHSRACRAPRRTCGRRSGDPVRKGRIQIAEVPPFDQSTVPHDGGSRLSMRSAIEPAGRLKWVIEHAKACARSEDIPVVRCDVDAVRFRPQPVPHEQHHVAHVLVVALLEVGTLRLAVRRICGQQAEPRDHDGHDGGSVVPAGSQWGRA